ncbi:MAG: hypothetical protein WA484_00570 [Solirubrobacteraceae bacterium]
MPRMAAGMGGWCAMTEPLHRATPDLSTGLAESDANELLHPSSTAWRSAPHWTPVSCC